MVNFDGLNQIEIKDFVLPFSGRLAPDNKWIRLSKMIPWEDLAGKYTKKCLLGMDKYRKHTLSILNDRTGCQDVERDHPLGANRVTIIMCSPDTGISPTRRAFRSVLSTLKRFDTFSRYF